MTNPDRHFIISETVANLKMFFYAIVVFSYLCNVSIKDFGFIAVTPYSCLEFSEHFHLHIEPVSFTEL